MSKRCRPPRPWRRALRAALFAVLLALLATPLTALAHPLDQYLQATYITVAPAQLVVELDLSPGVLVAPQALALLDTDGDQQLSDAEGRAYADTIVQHVALQVDGQPLALTVTKIDLPEYLVIQAGYGTIRIFTSATLADGMAGTHAIAYSNNNAPAGVSYQVNTFIETGAAITLGTQNRNETQQSIAVDYTIGGATATASPTVTGSTATGQASRLLGYLDAPTLSLGTMLLALALAAGLGGLHALTPGHGKTLVAAYLVGSRGTVRHAALLGAVVTATHTASVIAIGLLALFASHFVVPGVLVPLLQICSGLLVVVLGFRLVWQRWRAFRARKALAQRAAHDHTHDGDYPLVHDHGDGRTHSHLPPSEGFKVGNVAAMGVSGGLVPCPEALGVMIVAIGLGRIALGLGLIVAFSVGLAAVLIGLGILLVRARTLVERVGGLGGRWSAALPLASALIVTALGLGIVYGGLASYVG